MSTTTFRPPAVPHHAHGALHRTGLALRGVLALALGGYALWRPGIATAIFFAFAVFAVIDGAIRLVVALRGVQRDPAWWLHAAEGLVGIGIGIVMLRFAHGLIALTWSVAGWSFLIGVLSIAFAAIAWRRIPHPFFWVLGGLVAIVFAALVLWGTFGGVLAVGYVLGLFGVVYGVVSLVIAMRRSPEA